MAVSTLVRHRFLSRSLHTLHETHNDTYTASRGRCNHTATSPPPCLFLIFGVALLPRRSRRAHRGQGIKGPARGTRGRLIVRHVICSALESAFGRRVVGLRPPRPDIEYLRASLIGGGAAGHGQSPHAGSKSCCGPRAPAGAGRGRSTVAGFGARSGSPAAATGLSLGTHESPCNAGSGSSWRSRRRGCLKPPGARLDDFRRLGAPDQRKGTRDIQQA